MEAKTIEIRDRATMIVALAVRLDPGCERDRHLLARAGYGLLPAEQSEYILLTNFVRMKTEHDPFAWGDRTMHIAHRELLGCDWDAVQPGAVFDVEFILGETDQPKAAEA